MRPGEKVRVRVVGLGAYKRKWHDSLASVLEVDHKRRMVRIMFEGEESVLSFDMIDLVNEEMAENNQGKRNT